MDVILCFVLPLSFLQIIPNFSDSLYWLYLQQVILASTFLDQRQFLLGTPCSAYPVASFLKEPLGR